MTVTTWAFWKQTIERTISTMAQTFVAIVTAKEASGYLPGVIDIDWMAIASVTVMAGILSIAKCLAAGASPVGESGTPSLVKLDQKKDQMA